eukprot:ANDGO_00735.mRNA.1 hypothetical protein
MENRSSSSSSATSMSRTASDASTPSSQRQAGPLIRSSPLLANQSGTLQADVQFYTFDVDVDEHALVHLDIERLDPWFESDTTAYIDHSGLLINGIADQYLDLRTKCKQKGKVEVEIPQISCDFEKKILKFKKGAHAFAVMRDFKQRSIPVLVEQSLVTEYTMRFLSSESQSVTTRRTMSVLAMEQRRARLAVSPKPQP